MNKGILIIDKMPEYCDEHCKFCDSFFNCQYVGDDDVAKFNAQSLRDLIIDLEDLVNNDIHIHEINDIYIQEIN